jgi:beta-aspartyl-peptidase (threonine type)
MISPLIAIHGGAGTIARTTASSAEQAEYREALAAVLRAGQALLAQGASALDAVTEAVRLLEECPLFNAGRGAVYTADERHELDASVMRGTDLACGAVAGVTTVRNPVLAARTLLEKGGPVMLIGPAAERYAAAHGCEQVPPDWFGTPRRLQQLRAAQAASQVVLDHVVMDPAAPLDERGKFGTVGAVARDAQGRLAAATSTGGMTNKRPGRVGDSPILGAGCYADDRSVAVSCTGVGESFIRAAAAHEVSALVRHAGLGTREAARRVVHEVLPPLGGHGGLIAVGADGEVALPFNTEGMYRGWARVGQAPVVAIYEGEDIA